MPKVGDISSTPTPTPGPTPTPAPAPKPPQTRPPSTTGFPTNDSYTPPAEGKGVLGHVADFGSGLWAGGADLVTGLGSMAQGAWNLTGGWVTNPEASQQTVQTLKNVGSAVVNNPGAVLDAVAEPYKRAWNEGRPGEAIGRGTFEVISVIAGTKGLDKLAKGSKVAGAADDVARVANAADDAARTARAGEVVANGARTAETTGARTAEATGARTAEVAAGATDDAARLANLRAPARRHNLRAVDQKTVAKDVNSVFEPGVDVAGDVAKIRAGQAERVGDRFVVNGRTYGHHDGTLYPISGPGIHTLDRGAFKALGVYNKFGGETETAVKILDNMGIGAEQRAAALRAWRAGQP